MTTTDNSSGEWLVYQKHSVDQLSADIMKAFIFSWKSLLCMQVGGGDFHDSWQLPAAL